MNSAKVKVLLVHSTLHIGGAEEVSANLCRKINKSEFEVHACFLKEKGLVAERIENEGTVVHAVAKTEQRRTDYMTWWRLRKLIRKEGFRIIHSHDVHSMVDSALCRLTTPGIRHVHTFHFGNYPNRDKTLKRLESAVWRVPDKLVAVSEVQRSGIRELYAIPDDRIETVWNGVDVPSPVDPLDGLRQRVGDKLIIGSINTLIEQKGMPELVKTAGILKDRSPTPFVFVVAGGGPMLEDLRRQVVESGVEEEVVFLDWVDQAACRMLPYVDIFFQPSNWEAMSIVLLEAMALGRPLVTTSVGETPRVVTDGEHGLIVPPGDVERMADALERLLNDRELRSCLAASARKHYNTNFTARCMAERHEVLYRSLLK